MPAAGRSGNGLDGERLRGYVERLERLKADKQQIAEDERAVYAELKAAGYTPKYVRWLIRRRAAKPADVQEAEVMCDLYLHALGMASETPLFRHVGLMGVDLTARDAVLDAFRQLVPPEGDIIVRIGGAPVRVWRDKAGATHVEDWTEAPPAPAVTDAGGFGRPPAAGRPVPDVDDDGARGLGSAAYQANEPVIANPFPFGDRRRPLWDEGWREAAGSDGMGPQ